MVALVRYATDDAIRGTDDRTGAGAITESADSQIQPSGYSPFYRRRKPPSLDVGNQIIGFQIDVYQRSAVNAEVVIKLPQSPIQYPQRSRARRILLTSGKIIKALTKAK